MDLNLGDLKGRIAEALVESIFRRAFYRVARIGRESQIPGMLKLGAGEFSPDFLVWKQVPGDAAPAHLHRLLPIASLCLTCHPPLPPMGGRGLG